jgi:signal transduction histidine kinase
MILQDLNREMEGRLLMAARLIEGGINTTDLKYLELKGKIYSDYMSRLSALKEKAGVNNIMIIGSDRKILLSLAPEGGDFYLNLDSYEIGKALNGSQVSSPLYRGALGRYYKTGYVPLGGAALAVEASALYMEYINHYRVSLLIVSLVILALSLLMSFFITSGITRSIRRLKEKAEAIARREFDKGIKVGGEEEIRVLAYTLEGMEKELQEYIKDREKMASVGEFSAGVAHEIRNSLASLSGYAELIREKAKDEKVRKYADDITKNAMKMSSFLNNFLDYTKEFRPEMQEADVSAVIEETVAELPQEARDCVNVVSDPGGIQASIDIYLLKKALYNILMNAYQACDKKEKLITVTAVRHKGDGSHMAKISVKDNGKGMPDEMKSKIFHPFFTGRKEGTGLGLAISYKIIKEIHKGGIKVDSVEGQWTEVSIII